MHGRSSEQGVGARAGLSARILRWRSERGLSQAQLAERAGFARSTLSKIENGQLSPTFEILLKLARGFDADITDLLQSDEPAALTGRISIVRGAPAASIDYPGTRIAALGQELKGRRFKTSIAEFTCTDIAQFGPWNRHETEDMLYVLSGSLAFHSEGYEVMRLEPGDSLHFDGRMPHACLTAGKDLCRCLYVYAVR